MVDTEHGCGVVVVLVMILVVVGVEMDTVTAVYYERCWCRREEEKRNGHLVFPLRPDTH